MKRTNNFAFQGGMLNASCGAPKVSILEPYNDNSELNRLLNIVFAPDDNGIVRGDLACFMSDKASPEVRDFIKECLMLDMSNYRLPSIPDGWSDEDVETYSRQFDETREEYAQRMRDIVQTENSVIENAQREIDTPKDD